MFCVVAGQPQRTDEHRSKGSSRRYRLRQETREVMSSVGNRRDLPPPASLPWMPNTGASDGSRSVTIDRCLRRAVAVARPIATIVLPSPNGVGLMAVTPMYLAARWSVNCLLSPSERFPVDHWNTRLCVCRSLCVCGGRMTGIRILFIRVTELDPQGLRILRRHPAIFLSHNLIL